MKSLNRRNVLAGLGSVGASLVTKDRPIGDRQSSPQVWNEYAATSQSGLTSLPPSLRRPAKTMNT